MSWRAKVYHSETGAFLASLTVKGTDLKAAEQAAISKACLALRGDPRHMTVRELHAQGGRGHE